MAARWTQEEIDMLKMNLPIPEISRKIGRSESAVKDKIVSLRLKPSEGIFMPEAMTAYEKEARILKLAQKYGIKLMLKETV